MNSKFFCLAISFVIIFIGTALAQDAPGVDFEGVKIREPWETDVVDLKKEKAKKGKEEEEKVITGIIANTAGVGQSGAVEVETAGSSPGDEQSVISGSVSNNAGKCTALLTNSSEKNSYSVRFQVIGTNLRGRQAMKKNFSTRLAPGAKFSREFTCKPEHTMQLKLRSAVKR